MRKTRAERSGASAAAANEGAGVGPLRDRSTLSLLDYAGGLSRWYLEDGAPRDLIYGCARAEI